MKLLKAEAGVNDGKAGLLSAAGLFAKGGIFDKKSESFNIQELDPYLLFDARSSMLGTLENPTLDLDPATPSTLDVITATRAGVATYTDPDGNIATASADTVRVDYTQGAELTPTKFQRVGYSTPDSNWATVDSTLVENFEAAPDGTQSASKVTKLAVSGSGSSNDRIKYPTISIANGTTYSVSVHLKNIDVTGFTTIAARVSGGSLFRVKFIWDTSVLSSESGTTSNRLVEDLGDGWYRVSFSFESNGTAADLEIDVDRSTGGREDTSSILVWGAQFEEGTTASDFVANTTGSPLWIASPTFGPRVPMILVEPSATNLLDYSEDFSQWAKTRCSLGEQIEAPDGSITAYKIIPNTESAKHEISTSSGSYTDATVSVFAKAGEQSRLQITKSLWGTTNFDLLAGTVTSGTGTIESVGDGWFRCTASYVASPSQASIFIIVANDAGNVIYEGDGTSGLYLWGAQLEAGSVSTSYIPTQNVPVTRAADDLVISGSAFSSFFNGSEGTFYIEAIDKDVLGSAHAYIVGQGTSQFFLYKNNAVAAVNNFDGVNGIDLSGIVSNQLFRAAVSYKTGVSPAPSVKSLSLDGTTLEDRTYNGNFASTNILKIGSGYTNVFSGHYRRIIYWPTHSSRL